MNKRQRTVPCVIALLSLILAAPVATAQDRFEKLPGYDRFQATRRQLGSFVTGGRVSGIRWADNGRSVRFKRGEQFFSCDLTTGEVSEISDEEMGASPRRASGRRPRGSARPARGRQVTKTVSPDGQWIAEFRDWNLHLSKSDDSYTFAITTDGNRKFKYATGSWVYGEELRQTTAMWWSPDSQRIAFYEFDERHVKDYYLTPDLTKVQNTLYAEAYPKPGAPNPIVGLLIYDLPTRSLIRVPIGDDKEQYVYHVQWTPDGSMLLFNRTNRHQNHLDVVAYEPATGASHIVVSETQETWQENSPQMRWLRDGKRFIWATERSGRKQYELRHLDGRRLFPISRGDAPCLQIVKVDEIENWVYYTAFSAENPLHGQLHRARLDGTEQARLTTENLNHTMVNIAADHRHFIATMESIEVPPRTAVYTTSGDLVAVIAQSDTSQMNGRPLPEMFIFKADDGVTDLYGVLFKPLDFDPNRQYPLLINVYGGPLSQSVRARFRPTDPYCEFGFIIAQIDNRGTRNRGKAFEGATYLKLGTIDLKDQADGVKYLTQRPYIDGNRVGITGHSYGGFMAVLAIVKYPDLFHVAVAGSSVTDWRNYDTIYTERFMRTPQENPEGYDAGSAMTYADQLKGKLLLLHGMVDDNVHPSNVWQLVDQLQKKRKPFTMMFFPNSGHGIGSPSVNPLKWEFLVEHLILNGGKEPRMHTDGDGEREEETADQRG